MDQKERTTAEKERGRKCQAIFFLLASASYTSLLIHDAGIGDFQVPRVWTPYALLSSFRHTSHEITENQRSRSGSGTWTGAHFHHSHRQRCVCVSLPVLCYLTHRSHDHEYIQTKYNGRGGGTFLSQHVSLCLCGGTRLQ